MSNKQISIGTFIWELLTYLLIALYFAYETSCDIHDAKPIFPVSLTLHLGLSVLALVKMAVCAVEFHRQHRLRFSILVNCIAAFLVTVCMSAAAVVSLFIKGYYTSVTVTEKIICTTFFVGIAVLVAFWGKKQVRKYRQER